MNHVLLSIVSTLAIISTIHLFFGTPSGTAAGCIETAVIAAREGDLTGIQSCLDVGWDVNARNKYGPTALQTAAKYGNVNAVAALIKAGADVNAKRKDGRTALHRAASNGKVNAIAALIKAGADVNAKDNDGKTYLGGRTSL